ncbi:hypothetical protein HK104_008701 [Borealophlyctis nickersoniae]|nr:hypothetical protein HK104_008701 [Borealophlyctis nickersoniae]
MTFVPYFIILTLSTSIVTTATPVQYPILPTSPRPLSQVSAASSVTVPSCPPLTPRAAPPTSVHDLRIDDIKVIAALGDSITAAFGAKGLGNRTDPLPLKSTYENRGVSFSMGGDPNSTTLPNLLRRFQKDLVGASVGSHPAEICYGLWCLPFQYHPEEDNLNAAQTGAMVFNLIHELDYLISQMKATPGVDFDNDFKLLTLFIGSNDVCLGCSPGVIPTLPSPDTYEALMRAVLERIRKSIPRVIVNVLMNFNVSQVYDLTYKDPWCATLRNTGLTFECTCAFLPGPAGPTTRLLMDTLTQLYNQRLLRIAASYRSSTPDPSFAMMVDPLLSDVRIKEWGLEYLSNVDCFHPGVGAHEVMGVGVWNNLFRPYGSKRTSLDPSEEITAECPADESRIVTT